MCDLVDSGLGWIEVGHERHWRLTATGRIASVTGRAVEYPNQTVGEIRDVNAVVRVIDRHSVTAGRGLHRRLAAARGVGRIAGRRVDDRDRRLINVADIECVSRRVESQPDGRTGQRHDRGCLAAARGVDRIAGCPVDHCDRVLIKVGAGDRRVDRVRCRIKDSIERARADGYRGDRRAVGYVCAVALAAVDHRQSVIASVRHVDGVSGGVNPDISRNVTNSHRWHRPRKLRWAQRSWVRPNGSQSGRDLPIRRTDRASEA